MILVMILVSIALIITGMLILIISILRTLTREKEHDKIEAGGVLIVGPIPIIIGTNLKIAKTLIILAIILFITSIVLFILIHGLIR